LVGVNGGADIIIELNWWDNLAVGATGGFEWWSRRLRREEGWFGLGKRVGRESRWVGQRW
jgi:hypothetical protein